jgi:hypothetical protein
LSFWLTRCEKAENIGRRELGWPSGITGELGGHRSRAVASVSHITSSLLWQDCR